MKKVLAILMVLAMLMPAFAMAEEPVTLLIWEGETELEFMKAAAAKYTELHPNVSFEFSAVSHTDAVQKLELDGPTGLGPDVFAAPHDKMGQMAVGELVLPNPYAAEMEGNFVDAAITAMSYGGEVLGYPLTVETYALFYNKALIETAPTTWEEVIAFCKEYNDPANDQFGIVWEVNAPYYNYMFLSAYGAELFGPEGTDAAAHNINTPEAIKGMEYFASLKEQILPVNGADLTGDFCNALFMDSQKTAMYITGPWSITSALNAGVDLGVTTIPMLPDSETPPTSFSGIRGLFVSSFSENPEVAQDFANFIVSKEMLELRYEMLDTLTPRTDIPAKDAYNAGILEQMVYAKPMPPIPQMDQYWTTMGSAFPNIWNGADVAAELNTAAEAMEAVQ
ncbi:MAG: maltose ABC transporter substrate-binding protein [Oscillospiraceae bacterium]|jgi:arabinogalactan oligomer/maltooligosaccharide transport system substrate-binding protein|nr:maltose ABC transporter substrate-binding protein [Oscillospiraceae bacterium]